MEDSREAVDADPEVEDDPDPPAATVTQHQPSSSRQQRNKAEKQRRDKLNNFITELSTLVPMVASSPKRMDKTSILRLSATYLRMYRCLPLTSGDLCSLPSTQDSRSIYAHLLDILLDMDGFMLIVNATGKIVFVTHTVEKLLGHPQNDLLGQSLYNITCPDDHAELRKNLTPDEDPSAASASPVASDDSSSDDTTSSSAQSSPSPRLTSGTPEAAPPGPTPPPERQRRSFYLHLSQRAVSRSDSAQYETVHILGYLKVPHKPERGPPTHTRSRKQREPPATNSNDIVLVAVAQLFKEKKITDLSLLEASRDEYVTRHTKDGRIIYSDHRISVVAGYMAEEVSGLSAFNFMHKEDVKLTLIALQRMYDLGEGHGSSCYRLMSKSGQFIYLRTHGYLEYDKDTQDVTTFICINTLMTEKEGEDGLKEMKKRFSASIASIGMADFHNVITPGPSSVSAPEQPAISPVALEDSLPLSDMSQYMSGSEEQNHSPQPGPNAHYVNVVLYSHPSAHGQPNRVEPPKVQLSPLSPTCTATRLPVVTSSSSIVSSTTEVRPVERPTVLRESVITERVSAMPVPIIRSTMVECREPNTRLEVEDVSSFRDSEPKWCKETTVLKRTISADLESAGTSKRLHTGSKINRLRRRDSHPSPMEALRVEVPPTMSPDEQHRAILMRGGGPSSSPLYSGSNRSQTSPLQTHFGLLPGNGSISRNIIMHSPNSPPQSIAFFSSKVIRSPSPQSPSINTVQFSSTHISEYVSQSSPHSPAHSALNFPHFNREQGTSVLSPASAFINCQNPVMSPEHVDSDTFSSLGLPEPDNNPDFHELLNLPLDTSVDGLKPEFISLDNLPDTFVEVTGSPDVAYRGLNVTAEVAPVLQDQVYSTMNKELRRHHLQLESRMQLQETQINSIEQDLDQVPLADQVFRTNLTQLQAQHKKQQQLLNNLKQDHHKMHCAEKLNVCNVKQDVGV